MVKEIGARFRNTRLRATASAVRGNGIQNQSFLEADVLPCIAETYFAQHHLDKARNTWKHALDLYNTQHRPADAHRVIKKLAAIDEYSSGLLP
jgi:hypothetical protein